MGIRIVSDVHLGSPACRAGDFNDFLDDCDKVIINGDLVDSWDLRKWPRRHLAILDRLRTMDVVLIAGNHEESADKAQQVTGMRWHDSYQMGRCWIEHGHRWDREYPILADVSYRLLWAAGLVSVARRLATPGCVARVREGALRSGHDEVVCGHTHVPERVAGYANSGCWTEGCHWLDEELRVRAWPR